jgi:hypothetical protein
MKFMLLSYDDEQAWQDAGETALKTAMQEAVALTHRLAAKGQYLAASPLEHSSTAVCLRLKDGKMTVTDGPYAETHEMLGGFYIVDVPTVEDAIEIAKQHPGMRYGAVEIRPVFELDGLPPTRL